MTAENQEEERDIIQVNGRGDGEKRGGRATARGVVKHVHSRPAHEVSHFDTRLHVHVHVRAHDMPGSDSDSALDSAGLAPWSGSELRFGVRSSVAAAAADYSESAVAVDLAVWAGLVAAAAHGVEVSEQKGDTLLVHARS